MGNPDPLASWAELSHNIDMYFFYFLVVPVMTYKPLYSWYSYYIWLLAYTYYNFKLIVFAVFGGIE